METSERNYLPVGVVIVVVNVLFIGGVWWYLHQPRTGSVPPPNSVQTELPSPADTVVEEATAGDGMREKREEIAASMEWKVVSIEDEEVVLKGGPSGEDQMEFSLGADIEIVGGKDIQSGDKVIIKSTPAGKIALTIVQ